MAAQKVYISDDTWLVALKFLTCPQWTKMRYVSSQINEIVDRNVSRLPKMLIDTAAMYYIQDSRQELTEELKKLSLDQYTTVALDTVMQSRAWFKRRGSTIDTADDVIIDVKTWNREYKSNVYVCILGTEKEFVLLSEQEKHFPWFRIPLCGMVFHKPVLFYAQFDPVLNQCWHYLAHFLKCIFHPTSYIKRITMSTVSQKFIDHITNGEKHYIVCDSFKFIPDLDLLDTSQKQADSLKWLEKNVRSDSISLPEWMVHRISKARAMLTNFIFDTSQKCKAQELVFSLTYSGDSLYVELLDVLIEDFFALPVVHDAIPTVVIDHYPYQEQYRAHLGENLIGREIDSQGADALYVFRSGEKRIRIWFYRNISAYMNDYFKVCVKFYTI